MNKGCVTVNILELKKQLDESQKQLSDILQECQQGSTEQALLEASMNPLLQELISLEEDLFSGLISLSDKIAHRDDN